MEQLDREQRRAIEEIAKDNVVIAGAGSGKTRVLVALLVKLIEEGCSEEKIILTTFTRQAAAEMRGRAAAALDQQLERLKGGTIHSLAINILTEQADQSLRVINEEEAMAMIEEIALQITEEYSGEDLPLLPVALLLERYNQGRENNQPYVIEGLSKQVIDSYQKTKESLGLVDYTDLLLLFDDWLTEAGADWASSLRAVLVDEGQDLNLIQSQIISQLSKEASLFIIGDPGQSIYGWRGGGAETMIEVSQRARLSRLSNNYRSLPEIVELANLVMPATELAGEMVAQRRDNQAQIKLIESKDPSAEAAQVADWIEDYPGDYNEQAVLARTHNQLKAVERELLGRGVPLVRLGRDRDPWRNLMIAFMRLSENGSDLLALRQIGGVISGTENDAITEILEQSPSPADDLAKLSQDPALIEAARLITSERGASLWRQLAYGPLFEIMSRSGQSERALQLAELEWDPLLGLPIDDKEQRPGVAIATVHAAKGLEWPSVALIGLGRGGFPLANSPRSEEERLFYVAITRSRDRLLLSQASWRERCPFINSAVIELIDQASTGTAVK